MSKRRKTLDENFFVRYKNRKLYSWATSSYVTLDHLYNKLENGHDVTIVDRRTDEDITGICLAREVVNYYAQKMRLAPTLAQVKELISLIKTWELKDAVTLVAAHKATKSSYEKKSQEVKQEKDTKNNISQEAKEVTHHDMILPIGAGNCKTLSHGTLEPADDAMNKSTAFPF